MMKLSYLLAPLLMIPVIGSCNKSINDRINNQEELMAAVHFDNVEYMQIISKEPKPNKPKLFSYDYCSPTMYRTSRYEDGENIDRDLYVEHKDDSYISYSKDGDGPWIINSSCSPEEFITPQNSSVAASFAILFGNDEPIFGRPLTLDDFNYSKGEYICKFTEVPDYGVKCNFSLSFLDKKVKKLSSYSDEGKGGDLTLINSFEFEYEEITPELPDIPSK